MSKRSFNEIEQAIKAAAEAHEPAFDEQSWKKMEALLDKEKDRKKPVIFWLWILVPLLIGSGLISYFAFNNEKDEQSTNHISKPDNSPQINNISNNSQPGNKLVATIDNRNLKLPSKSIFKNDKVDKENRSVSANGKRNNSASSDMYQQNDVDLNSGKKIKDKQKGKMTAIIRPARLDIDDDNNTDERVDAGNKPQPVTAGLQDKQEKEEVIVIQVDADKTSEKEIEKIVDSVVKKLSIDKKQKNKIARLYIVAVGGAEASGVKLFSTDKITARYGLGLGYQLNKNISVQTGFYTSSKKYTATGSAYKTKPGSYWNMVDIKTIEANCRVYEIPLSVVYNFTPGKKINVFASAGLSSYIMKKEDYRFYYERYGTAHQANANYKGNKNLFSVLRLSAGIEKKISRNFSITASPGIAIPLSGVGEGEVKLYSTDISIGIKLTPFQKK